MKTARIAALALAAGAINVASAQGFGPANCVSLSRSSAGSCVLHTNCAGQDLAKFDFSFDCVAKSGRQTHSLGVGSFDLQEEYDTDLKCDQCMAPPSKPAASKPLAKRAGASAGVSLAAVSVSRATAKLFDDPDEEETEKKDEPAPKAEWYGPEECVGVWRDEKSGSCVMQTDCDADVQLAVYEFGLVCVDKDDEMARHIFGMGSFGHKETFSTLIKCEQCLALDEYMDGNKAVGQLTKLVKSIKSGLQDVTGAVGRLNAEVFPKAPAPAGAAGPAGAPGAAVPQAPAGAAPVKPAKFLVVAPHQQQPEAPPAPKPTPVQPAVAKQEEAQSQPQPVAVEEGGHEVTHVKKKHSQSAPVENQSMQEILAAAVKGAQANGVNLGSTQAVLEAAKKAPNVPMQATQTQVVREKKQQAVEEVVVEQKQAKQQDDDSLDDEDDDHSKAEDDDED